ncbi:unnamed protein product [Cyprideis torosa]|uniref:Acetyltransferase component of pyruvate dehydrogenase complex n=1 Tax=Cyprideis torosa TaxID=163714 RepID=A0A7R8WP63_9CRUS|nr:unnamed protein product [Cyprideis torosa]CAG0900393.1 unnamed protein product [Cyprideis torosa]
MFSRSMIICGLRRSPARLIAPSVCAASELGTSPAHTRSWSSWRHRHRDNGVHEPLSSVIPVGPLLRVQCRGLADLPPHVKVTLPALSPTMEQGTIVSWAKKEGDRLNDGDLLAEIETDKATMGFETPEEGYLAKILIEAGAKDVPVGRLLCIIVDEEADVAAFKDFKADASTDKGGAKQAPPPPTPSAPPPPQPQAAPTPPAAAPVSPGRQAPPPSSPSSRVLASPLARRLAAEKGLDLKTVPAGSDGIVRSGQLSMAPVSAAPPSAPAAGAPAAVGAAPATVAATAPFDDLALSAMRKTIAKRLVESKTTLPHYYLTSEVRLDRVLAVRERLNKDQKDVRLSVNDFLIKAASLACLVVPEVNSAWMGDFIRQYNSVDMSIAVSTDKGLITPIIFGAEQKGIGAISKEMKALAAKARDGKLQPHEFQGGTFCLSNLGMYGIFSFSAIINPPQSAILAVGTTQTKYVPGANGPEPAQMLYATLSCDHRVIDGAVGAQWLKELKQNLENPERMLL